MDMVVVFFTVLQFLLDYHGGDVCDWTFFMKLYEQNPKVKKENKI